MADPRRSKQILRYTAGERTNHWLIALTFILLALSGLALFHPAFSWLYALLGGGPWTRILHPFIGVVMFVCFFVFAGHMWRHNLMTKNDRQWLRQLGDVLNNREDKLPEVGKYNAGQKLLFYVLVICMLGLVLTGIVMWRPYFAGYFPIDGIRVASLLHAVFCFCVDLRDHCAYLRGDLGQGFGPGHGARHRELGLGLETSSRLVPFGSQGVAWRRISPPPSPPGPTARRTAALRAWRARSRVCFSGECFAANSAARRD